MRQVVLSSSHMINLILRLQQINRCTLIINCWHSELKIKKRIGLLWGAWGYTSCIMYRAFIWRMEAIWGEELPNYETLEVKVLILALIVSFPAFIVSLVKFFPKKNPN